jgi:Lrp/AsnC family transcriptional regulator, leucine-responsive regulatory protein
MNPLDRFDRQLLNLVQEDASQTAEQLSQMVSLSVSAVQRRLKRLRELGIIAKHIAVLAPQGVVRHTTFLASLQVAHERPDLLAALRSWLARCPQVQQAYYVTGEADFVLVVTAPDAQAYEALMSTMIQANPNIKRYNTNVVMGLVKQGLSVPIPIDDEA